MTPSEFQKEKLSALFRLSGLDIRPGAMIRTKCVITGLSEIQKLVSTPIIPEEVKEITLDYNEMAIFNSVAYDHSTKKVYLEFVAGESVIYYSYTDHGPFSIPFDQMFELVIVSSDTSILK
jgi:hypothetical protein